MLPCSVHRLIVAEYRVDFRRYFDGLLSEAYRLGYDPYAGDCVVFAKTDRTQIRVLLYPLQMRGVGFAAPASAVDTIYLKKLLAPKTPGEFVMRQHLTRLDKIAFLEIIVK